MQKLLDPAHEERKSNPEETRPEETQKSVDYSVTFVYIQRPTDRPKAHILLLRFFPTPD